MPACARVPYRMQGRDGHEVHELDERLHVDLTSRRSRLKPVSSPSLLHCRARYPRMYWSTGSGDPYWQKALAAFASGSLFSRYSSSSVTCFRVSATWESVLPSYARKLDRLKRERSKLSRAAVGSHPTVCICMYLCMFVGMYVYACMHARTHVCMDQWMNGRMDRWMACMHACVQERIEAIILTLRTGPSRGLDLANFQLSSSTSVPTFEFCLSASARCRTRCFQALTFHTCRHSRPSRCLSFQKIKSQTVKGSPLLGKLPNLSNFRIFKLRLG